MSYRPKWLYIPRKGRKPAAKRHGVRADWNPRWWSDSAAYQRIPEWVLWRDSWDRIYPG